MKKIIYLIPILLFASCIFISPTKAAPPPPPDGNSLTYVSYASDSFGFSLEYPEGWYTEERPIEKEVKILSLPHVGQIRFAKFASMSTSTPYRLIEINVLERKPGFKIKDDHIIKTDGSRFDLTAAWWGTWEEEKEEIVALNKISNNGWTGLERGFESENLLHIDTILSTGPESQYIYWIQTIGARDKENVINIYQHLKESLTVNTESDNLIKPQAGHKVYKIISGKRLWIPSPQAFNRLGLKWANIQQVAGNQLNQYPRLKLAREAGTNRIWYLTEGGLRRHILTDEAFSSYGNKYKDVVKLDAETLSAYPINKLIRSETGYKVYKIEGNKKRWIKTAQAFNQLGYKWENIAPVNQTELAAYKQGGIIDTTPGNTTPKIEIVSPADETSFSPGQEITVKVLVSTDLNLDSVNLIALDKILEDSSEPYEFDLTIGDDLAGNKKIGALAISNEGTTYEDTITIKIQPTANLIGLSVDPTAKTFQQAGRSLPLQVIGSFDDGIDRNITKSDATIYTSNKPSVATVSDEGIVTAVTEGYTAISVKHGQHIATVDVTVLSSNHPPTANAGPDQEINVNDTVELNAQNSNDPDGDPLDYTWELIIKPSRSNAILSETSGASTALNADIAGEYILRLIADDNKGGSDSDSVLVTVKNN